MTLTESGGHGRHWPGSNLEKGGRSMTKADLIFSISMIWLAAFGGFLVGRFA